MKTINAVKITCQTYIGVVKQSSVPYKFGNCFSVLADDDKEYKICNFYAENLNHLIETNKVSFPIKIQLLGTKSAIIADERISDKFYNIEFCENCTPRKFWPMPQILRRELKFAREEIKIVGNMEIMKASNSSGLKEGYFFIKEDDIIATGYEPSTYVKTIYEGDDIVFDDENHKKQKIENKQENE